MTDKEVVYFSVNSWFSGENYPPTENFKKWLDNDFKQSFQDDEFCKENKLCVYYGQVDMSTNYTVSAPKEWVEKNCPELLTDDEYTYVTRVTRYKKNLFGKIQTICEDVEHKKKYSDFVYSNEDVDEGECDRIGDMPFREYREENFGSKYYETNWWGNDDDCDGEDDDDDNQDD